MLKSELQDLYIYPWHILTSHELNQSQAEIIVYIDRQVMAFKPSLCLFSNTDLVFSSNIHKEPFLYHVSTTDAILLNRIKSYSLTGPAISFLLGGWNSEDLFHVKYFSKAECLLSFELLYIIRRLRKERGTSRKTKLLWLLQILEDWFN